MNTLGLKVGKPKRNRFLNHSLPLFGVPKYDAPAKPTHAEMGADIDANLDALS
jgi:hypothetical protein